MKIKILIAAAILMTPLTLTYADPVDSHEGMRGHHPGHLSKLLSLTPDQKTKVEEIFKEEHEKFRALHEEAHSRIKEVLTPDQVAKWEKIIAQHKAKHHHKHAPAPEAPAAETPSSSQ